MKSIVRTEPNQKMPKKTCSHCRTARSKTYIPNPPQDQSASVVSAAGDVSPVASQVNRGIDPVMEKQVLVAGMVREEEAAGPRPADAAVHRGGSKHMVNEPGRAVAAARAAAVLVERATCDRAEEEAVEAARHPYPDQLAVVGAAFAGAWTGGAEGREFAFGEVLTNGEGPICIGRDGEGAVEGIRCPIRSTGAGVGRSTWEGAEVRRVVFVVAPLVVDAALALISKGRSHREKRQVRAGQSGEPATSSWRPPIGQQLVGCANPTPSAAPRRHSSWLPNGPGSAPQPPRRPPQAPGW